MKNKRIRKDKRIRYSYFSVWRFIFYFLFVGFVVTCSFMLFFSEGSYPDTDIVILNETISYRALITLGNILFLCLFFSIFDSIKKKISIGKPVERILDATHRITKGDFSVRIQPKG